MHTNSDILRDAIPKFREIATRYNVPIGKTDSALTTQLQEGMKRYSKWKERFVVELSAPELFRGFVFCEDPETDHVPCVAWEKLAVCYERNFFRRVCRPESLNVLETLSKRKLKIGLISNIISREVVYEQLEEYGISSFFQVVATSAEYKRRKPDPFMFEEMVKQLRVSATQAMYVGDTISRDIAGAKRACYGAAVQIRSGMTGLSDAGYSGYEPDLRITSLTELIDLFPPGGTNL